MTWTCPNCGKVHLDETSMRSCPCKMRKKCPQCSGRGQIVGGAFSPNQTCPRCGGSGVVAW